MIDSWEECMFNNIAYKVSKDKAKINSLVKTAEERISFFKKSNLNKNNANFIFEGYYTSLNEILHALLLSKGYKVKNHVCLGYFLKDVLNKKKLFRIFNDARYKRNSLVYYGNKMDFLQAKKIITNIKEMMGELKLLLEEN